MREICHRARHFQRPVFNTPAAGSDPQRTQVSRVAGEIERHLEQRVESGGSGGLAATALQHQVAHPGVNMVALRIRFFSWVVLQHQRQIVGLEIQRQIPVRKIERCSPVVEIEHSLLDRNVPCLEIEQGVKESLV